MGTKAKVALGTFAGLVVGFVVGAAAGGAAQQQAPQALAKEVSSQSSQARATGASVGYEVSAVELMRMYESNEVATDDLLRGKRVNVTGTVQAIDKDAFDNVVVRLATDNQFLAAQMKLVDSQRSAAASLRKGSQVKIACDGMRRVIGMPMGSDCVFAR